MAVSFDRAQDAVPGSRGRRLHTLLGELGGDQTLLQRLAGLKQFNKALAPPSTTATTNHTAATTTAPPLPSATADTVNAFVAHRAHVRSVCFRVVETMVDLFVGNAGSRDCCEQVACALAHLAADAEIARTWAVPPAGHFLVGKNADVNGGAFPLTTSEFVQDAPGAEEEEDLQTAEESDSIFRKETGIAADHLPLLLLTQLLETHPAAKRVVAWAGEALARWGQRQEVAKCEEVVLYLVKRTLLLEDPEVSGEGGNGVRGSSFFPSPRRESWRREDLRNDPRWLFYHGRVASSLAPARKKQESRSLHNMSGEQQEEQEATKNPRPPPISPLQRTQLMADLLMRLSSIGLVSEAFVLSALKEVLLLDWVVDGWERGWSCGGGKDTEALATFPLHGEEHYLVLDKTGRETKLIKDLMAHRQISRSSEENTLLGANGEQQLTTSTSLSAPSAGFTADATKLPHWARVEPRNYCINVLDYVDQCCAVQHAFGGGVPANSTVLPPGRVGSAAASANASVENEPQRPLGARSGGRSLLSHKLIIASKYYCYGEKLEQRRNDNPPKHWLTLLDRLLLRILQLQRAGPQKKNTTGARTSLLSTSEVENAAETLAGWARFVVRFEELQNIVTTTSITVERDIQDICGEYEQAITPRVGTVELVWGQGARVGGAG